MIFRVAVMHMILFVSELMTRLHDLMGAHNNIHYSIPVVWLNDIQKDVIIE